MLLRYATWYVSRHAQEILMSVAQRQKKAAYAVAEIGADRKRRRPAGEEREASFAGAALIDALLRKAGQLGIQNKELAEILGVSAPHFSFLTSGERRTAGLSDEVLRAAATFLEKPLVEVFHLAEKLSLEDYYYHLTLEDRLDKIYEAMRSDLVYGSVCVSRKIWASLPLQAKVLIGTMYEQHARTNLLPRPRLQEIVHG